MAALPYLQLEVAKYLADTHHLTTIQHGAYLLLIMNYWQRGKPLKNCNDRLASVARLSNDRWNECRTVLEEFFIVTEDEWIHERIEQDLAYANERSKQASAAGKASAAAKKAAKDSVHASIQRRLNGCTNARSTVVDVSFNEEKRREEKIKEKKRKEEILSTDKTPGIPDCPHAKIIELYHEILPMCRKTLEWHETRQGYLRARWKDYPHLEFWRQYFEKVKNSEFLTGRAPPRKETGIVFLADLEWLIRPQNFTKVLEGKYS